MTNRILAGVGSFVTASLLLCGEAGAVSAWTQRFYDNQNTTNVGDDPSLTPDSVTHLKSQASDVVPIRQCVPRPGATVNHTPVVSDGLLFFGDSCGYFYVVDLTQGRKRLIFLDTGTVGPPNTGITGALDTVAAELGTYTGVQATPLIATVTVPDSPTVSHEEKRIYIGLDHQDKSLWCLNVDKIITDRLSLDNLSLGPNDAGVYSCSGRSWPMSLAAQPVSGNESVLNGSAHFSKAQAIKVKLPDGSPGTEIHDVLFQPSTGLDCANGQFWALDAVTGEKLWIFDAVQNGDGQGGTIWSVPAMGKDGTVYLTTGDCVQKPQVGEKAESLVALDPTDGTVKWFHQRRLTDTQDFDIGNSPTVVDVPDGNGGYICQNIVSIDKDGCIYGFKQAEDIPDIGEPGFDPLRLGQQRVLWRACFAPGSLGGGFDASGASFHGRSVFAQSNQAFGHLPTDDVNAFSVDACTGAFQWASSSIGLGWGEGAIASGMFFQPTGSGRELQVVSADAGSGHLPTLLATVALPAAVAEGGGGPAIVDGAIYLPSSAGVVIVSVDPSASSPPVHHGKDAFHGPYPLPIAAAPPATYVPNPNSPYLDLLKK